MAGWFYKKNNKAHGVYVNGKEPIPLPKNMETYFSGTAQGSLFCASESVVSMSQEILGDSAGVCQGPEKAIIEDFLRAQALPWHDLEIKAQIKMGLSFCLFLLLLFHFPPSSLKIFFYWGIIYIQKMCPFAVVSAMKFHKSTYLSYHQSQEYGWLFFLLILCPTAPFSLPTLKPSIPHLHRRHKENPTLEKFITCLEKLQSLMFDKNCWMH